MRERKKEEEKRGTEREIAKPANITEQTAMQWLVSSCLTRKETEREIERENKREKERGGEKERELNLRI